MEITIIKTTYQSEADMITIHTLAGDFVIKERLAHTDQPGQLVITATRPLQVEWQNETLIVGTKMEVEAK